MNFFRLVRARLIGFWRKEELARELDEELRFHLALRTQENIRRGMLPAAAAREAQRRFGNLLQIKDAWRDVRGGGALDSFVQDIRFAARMLRKDRAFTFVAIVALAIGIGANTALFTVLSQVLLQPLPYTAPAEILSISIRDRTNPEEAFPFSYPDFRDFRERTRTVSRLGAFRAGSFVVRSDDGAAARVPGAWVTSEIFPLLGVHPAIGRQFTAAEEEPGQRVALISDSMWQERYARAANITHATLSVNGLEYRVIGVMPADFQFPVQNDPAQFWITFAAELAPRPDGSAPFPTRRDSHFLRLLGRLKPGVTQADAETELHGIAADLAAAYPATNQNYDACIVRPWLEEITLRVRPVLLMLIGAAFFTLCVACANVANLLLARGSTRRKEIAVRAALGAGRRRIFRQLLTESLLLGCAGGVSGLLLALLLTRYIVVMLPQDFPRAAEIAPDGWVLAFNVVITLLTSCLFGVAPGWRFARTALAPLLNDGTPQCSEPPAGRRTRNTLVIAEMVLAFVLLAGASLFISHLARLHAVPLGFRPENVTTVNIVIPDNKRADLPQHVAGLMAEVTRRLARLDLIAAVSAVSLPPMTPSIFVADFAIAGREVAPADLPLAVPHVVLPGYFTTMGIELKAGRDFATTDERSTAPVVIVNETLAQHFFPGESALGKRITPGLFTDPLGPVEREIVGVVADVQSDLTSTERKPQIYVPLTQCLWLDLTVVARSKWDPEELIRAIEDVMTDLDPNVAIAERGTMTERVARAAAAPRMNSKLLTAFAAVAVALTAIGVYGVMAYSVAQRRHDLGIRLALGAQPQDVFRLVLGEGVRLIICAVVLGAAFSISLAPLLQRIVGGDMAGHALIVCSTAILLSFVSLLACWIPAQRAAALEPLAALGER